jgi:hypothetical protein
MQILKPNKLFKTKVLPKLNQLPKVNILNHNSSERLYIVLPMPILNLGLMDSVYECYYFGIDLDPNIQGSS